MRPETNHLTQNPLISVVTRTIGHRPFLERCAAAIRSALPPGKIEWLVVDDRPSEGPPLDSLVAEQGVADRFEPSLVSSRMGHRAKAAAVGLNAALGSYVHILDDDDVVLPGFYAELVAMLENQPGIGAAASKAFRVVERPHSDGERYVEVHRARHYPELKSVTLASLAVTQFLPPCSVLFRRKVLEDAGGFDPAFAVGEDYDLLLRVLTVADIALLDRPLVEFHQRALNSGGAGNSKMTTDFQAEDAYFRNAMLRRDLAEGRIGLGWLLAHAELSRGSVKAERILDRLYRNRLLRSFYTMFRQR